MAWVNPFGKMLFLEFQKFCFYGQKKFFFPVKNIIKSCFSLILTKKKKKKFEFLLPKPWVNPLGKIGFLGV